MSTTLGCKVTGIIRVCGKNSIPFADSLIYQIKTKLYKFVDVKGEEKEYYILKSRMFIGTLCV